MRILFPPSQSARLFGNVLFLSLPLLLLLLPQRARAQRPIGIDVSGYQSASLNWATLKNTYGISFGWAKATEATTLTIDNFATFESKAKAAGVLIGAYHFARYDLDKGTNGAAAEANYFWSVAKNYMKDGGFYLMPMLDVEASFTGYTKTTLSQWINQWCVVVTNNAFAAGYVVKPCIYASSSHAAAMFDSTITKWTAYLADWNGQNNQTGAPTFAPWSKWTFWQYNDMNAAQAITTGDGDVFNGSLATLKATMLITSVSSPLLWTGNSGDGRWSTLTNWDGGAPGAKAAVLFDLTDAQAGFTTNNLVTRSVTIHSLTYSNWTYDGSSSGYLSQNTAIGDEQTLTVTAGLTVGVSSANGKGFTANPLTYATISGSHGTLAVTGGDINVGYQNSESSIFYIYALLDLRSLGNFTYIAPGGTFGIASALHRRQGGEVYLADTNVITAANIWSGTGVTGVGTHAGILHLGQSNELNSDNIIIGKDSEGDLDFRGGLTNATLRLRGLNGTSAAASVYLGWTTSAGSTWGRGTNDLSAGTVDIAVSNLFVAYHAGDISGATQITSDSLLLGASPENAVAVQNLTIGSNPGGPTATKTSQCVGLVDVQNGTITANKIVVGSSANAGSGSGTLNLHGGTFAIGSLALANLGGSGTATGSLNLTGGRMSITGNISAGGGASSCGVTNATLAVGGQIGSAGSYLGSLTLDGATLQLTPANGTNLCLFVDSLLVAGPSVILITNQDLVPGQFPLVACHNAEGLAGLSLSVPPGVAASLVNNAANQTLDLLVTATPAHPALPVLNSFATLTSNIFELTGSGVAYGVYEVYASDDPGLPMSQWKLIGSVTADSQGMIRFMDPATNTQRFYRLGK